MVAVRKKLTTAFVVEVVVNVAAISCQDAYELVTSHGGSGLTARLLPFSVDGLIRAASMGIFRGHGVAGRRDAGHQDHPQRPGSPRGKTGRYFRIVRESSSSRSTSCTTVNDTCDVDRLLTARAEPADG